MTLYVKKKKSLVTYLGLKRSKQRERKREILRFSELLITTEKPGKGKLGVPA